MDKPPSQQKLFGPSVREVMRTGRMGQGGPRLCRRTVKDRRAEGLEGFGLVEGKEAQAKCRAMTKGVFGVEDVVFFYAGGFVVVGSGKTSVVLKLAEGDGSTKGAGETELLRVIHVDINGPMEVASLGESNNMIVFIHDRRPRIKMKKSQALPALWDFIIQAEHQARHKVCIVRAYNTDEILSAVCGEQHLHDRGDGTRDAVVRDMERRFWAVATLIAAYLWNCGPK
ncbi:hypothetical protein BDK51DRAFT_47294 [Blyttiomyces helicus]|uniref:Uncharacterized protein n=1 Tax=Blyttiomyces helicus TaxID=388810 RepID=A0A4P9WIW0_9FUNG|nr:hypothetical protein BDK51DRAFT_47294 [Blyttiomyces helicus]|eukprot:RKO92744.1 hypothetical protein BDK51DRAFT_47294 [Blyttiomyces helicus]